MRTHRFLRELEHDRIVKAIKDAEAKTSGQIRVFLQRGKFEEDALERAQKKFLQLGMDKTRERNGVLIFVAPRAQKFAVIGDEGVHQKCGEQFWSDLVGRMRAHFLREDFTQALMEAIESTGALLARYFPKTGASTNELPDEIVEG
ncbi:MAG TPA: TPM domain-containing protein [Chthoniobacterales bacterium]